MNRSTFDIAYNVRTDGQIHTSALNLDAMTTPELECASAHPALHQDVRAYAVQLLAARDSRNGGYVSSALQYEISADRIYNVLPKSLRW